MKAATIIRRTAEEFYNDRFNLFNDRLNDGRRNIKVDVYYQWDDARAPQKYEEYIQECLKRLREHGYNPTLSHKFRCGPRIWVQQT